MIFKSLSEKKECLMAALDSSRKIQVTGPSGFIGLHTTLRLLQLGFKVRATVRTKSNENHVRETLAKYVERSPEFSHADLMKDEG